MREGLGEVSERDLFVVWDWESYPEELPSSVVLSDVEDVAIVGNCTSARFRLNWTELETGFRT